MRGTRRPLNCCRQCGYTWYPRGKNLSPSCPSCGSSATDLQINIFLEALFKILSIPFIALAQLLEVAGPLLGKALCKAGRGIKEFTKSLSPPIGRFSHKFANRITTTEQNMDRTTKIVFVCAVAIVAISATLIFVFLPDRSPSSIIQAGASTEKTETKPSSSPENVQTVASNPTPQTVNYPPSTVVNSQESHVTTPSEASPILSPAPSYSAPRVDVHGYYRKDGTYVAPYSRSYPHRK